MQRVTKKSFRWGAERAGFPLAKGKRTAICEGTMPHMCQVAVDFLDTSTIRVCLTLNDEYAKICIMSAAEWTVEYYVEDDGDVPVQAFLAALARKTTARFDWSIEQLRLRNVRAREPLVRHLENQLWELREESDTNIYRIIYSFVVVRRILLWHGFPKKTQKTPRRELDLARRRLLRFLEREGR